MKTTITFLITLCSFYIFAQEYIPDQIEIDGNTYDYRFHHMEYYFKYRTSKRPAINKDSTALNRNYVATFLLDKDRLYLKDLKIKPKPTSKEYSKSVIHNIFNNDTEKYLNWISGLYYVGTGEKLQKQTDSLHIEYSNYIVFEIKKGEIVRKDYFTNPQMKIFQNYQFERFHRTVEYKKLVEQLRQQTQMTDWDIDAHIRKNIIFYSKKNMLK